MNLGDPNVHFLFFDGDCGLCHHSVRFVLRRDAQRRFRFAPLEGETFAPYLERLQSEQQGAPVPDSMIVATPDGRLLLRSDGVVHILRQLGAPWRALGGLLALVPRPVRDLGYRIVARIRHRLFSRPRDVCPIPEGAQRQLFDP